MLYVAWVVLHRNRHIGASERRQLIPHVRFQVPFLGAESQLKSGFACAGLLCIGCCLNPVEVEGSFLLFRFVWWLDFLVLKEGASAFCSLRWLLEVFLAVGVCGFSCRWSASIWMIVLNTLPPLVGPPCASKLLPRFSAQKDHELWSFQSILFLITSINLKRDGVRICLGKDVGRWSIEGFLFLTPPSFRYRVNYPA